MNRTLADDTVTIGSRDDNGVDQKRLSRVHIRARHAFRTRTAKAIESRCRDQLKFDSVRLHSRTSSNSSRFFLGMIN